MPRSTALILSAALILAPFSAMAADSKTGVSPTQQAPLAAGSAAGVKAAEAWAPDQTTYIIGGVLVIGAAALLLSSNGGGHHSSTTTSGHP